MVQTVPIMDASSLPKNGYIITNDRLIRIDCGVCVSTRELPRSPHDEQVKTAVEIFGLPKNSVIYIDKKNCLFNTENDE